MKKASAHAGAHAASAEGAEMDRRGTAEERAYDKDLHSEAAEFDEFLTINGKRYRVPYRMVREVVFSNVGKDELIDLEHAARLQYRLMLMEPVLRAKVEFAKQRISIVYNNAEAENRKEKISLEGLMDTISKEGVHLYSNPREERDFDYVQEMYNYHFEPKAIREHPPYGYSREEWARMKPEYERKAAEGRELGAEKFSQWQEEYAGKHPEVFGSRAPEKRTMAEKLFGRKKKGEKQFWFHGI